MSDRKWIGRRALLALIASWSAASLSSAAAIDTLAPNSGAAVEHGHFDLSRPDIQQYVDQAAAQGLPRELVLQALAAAEPQPQILDAMSRPIEKTLDWWEYRARFVTPERIAAGRTAVARAQGAARSDRDRIPGASGVCGGIARRRDALRPHHWPLSGARSLATLAFDYPPRSNYFRKELTEFLLLAHEDGLDVLTIKGSYAGAMGALQFMPSSYRRFAVSEEHRTRRDLWTDWGDIFASVANYLHQDGWQYEAPVLAEAQLKAGQTANLVTGKLHGETVATLRATGLTIATQLPDDTAAILLAANEQGGPGYRVGFHNFYVLTRYNSSPLYAMAVFDLAQAIRHQVVQEGTL